MADYGVESLTRFSPTALAVGAILVAEDGRYLLQHRDDRPDIWFPNFWGTFGGAVEPGETLTGALRRELREELELEPARLTYFTQLSFDFTTMGSENKYRCYFEVPLCADDLATIRLHEGREMRLFTAREVEVMPDVTPYDIHVLKLHAMRDRVVPPDQRLRPPIR